MMIRRLKFRLFMAGWVSGLNRLGANEKGLKKGPAGSNPAPASTFAEVRSSSAAEVDVLSPTGLKF